MAREQPRRESRRSWNCGVEGPTGEPRHLGTACRQMRNMWATLMVSQGTPMIAHGGEIGHAISDNNVCQDSNYLGWIGHWWTRMPISLAFARKATTLPLRCFADAGSLR